MLDVWRDGVKAMPNSYVLLISLDDDYRIIISKEISEHYTNASVKEYFLKKQGDKIVLPSSYLPGKDYLQKHRERCKF